MWTKRDPVLSIVLCWCVQHTYRKAGMMNVMMRHKGHTSDADKLSTQDGILLWGSRIVLPPQGRSAILKQLYEGHPGMSRIKQVARSFIWWPDVDSQLEETVKSCPQLVSRISKRLLQHQWIHGHGPTNHRSESMWTSQDPFGQNADDCSGRTFQVDWGCADGHIHIASHHLQAANTVCNTWTAWDVSYGQWSNFTSAKFAEFMTRNGIKHVKTAPYLERAVHTVKEGLRKIKTGTIETKLAIKVPFSLQEHTAYYDWSLSFTATLWMWSEKASWLA